MDLDELLGAREGACESGDNLEYEGLFTAMEIAAQPGQERQAGDQILAAEDPDYSDIVKKALAVLERSHDLRAATTLAGAIVHTRGIVGFADATGYVRGCLERYWTTCHPQLDSEDDDDPTMRINSLRGLSAHDPVIRGLRRAPLTESRAFGRITLQDMLVASGELAADAGETAVESTRIKAAFEDTDAAHLSALLAAAQAAHDNMKAIDALFAEKTPGQGPELGEAVKTLLQIVRRLRDVVGVEEPVAEAVDDGSGAEQPRAAPGRGGGNGAINSPADVAAALDSIIGYYQRCEPSSPLPILLKRAKRLVGADFLTILKDMAPAGVDSVTQIGGLTDADG